VAHRFRLASDGDRTEGGGGGDWSGIACSGPEEGASEQRRDEKHPAEAEPGSRDGSSRAMTATEFLVERRPGSLFRLEGDSEVLQHAALDFELMSLVRQDADPFEEAELRDGPDLVWHHDGVEPRPHHIGR
jgi:hypothetical protein